MNEGTPRSWTGTASSRDMSGLPQLIYTLKRILIAQANRAVCVCVCVCVCLNRTP